MGKPPKPETAPWSAASSHALSHHPTNRLTRAACACLCVTWTALAVHIDARKAHEHDVLEYHGTVCVLLNICFLLLAGASFPSRHRRSIMRSP